MSYPQISLISDMDYRTIDSGEEDASLVQGIVDAGCFHPAGGRIDTGCWREPTDIIFSETTLRCCFLSMPLYHASFGLSSRFPIFRSLAAFLVAPHTPISNST